MGAALKSRSTCRCVDFASDSTASTSRRKEMAMVASASAKARSAILLRQSEARPRKSAVLRHRRIEKRFPPGVALAFDGVRAHAAVSHRAARSEEHTSELQS